MSLGRAPEHEDMHRSTRKTCEEHLGEASIFRLLARECHRLFPDEAFADLFTVVGRHSIPPRIVAVVMVLQRVFGLSDREAVERFHFDLRWKYAAGALDYNYPSFGHTVLVSMRARLRKSERPNRIFEATLDVAREAGLVGRKRVLDSTALYDAVATQDTVTLIRSSIRGLLAAAGPELESELRAVLKRDDDYITAGKPWCDWDDAPAREALVDALARDAYAVIACLDGRKLEPAVRAAAELVAAVVGQDLEQTEGGVFRIARRVAKDRIISTVDTEARHGHKSSAHGFDGYKGHISIDPDSEIITATKVTAGNVADGEAAKDLLDELLGPLPSPTTSEPAVDGNEGGNANETAGANASPGADEREDDGQPINEGACADVEGEAVDADASPDVDADRDANADANATADADAGDAETAGADHDAATDATADAHTGDAAATAAEGDAGTTQRVEVYGDASYGTAGLVEHIEAAGAEPNVKVQPASGPKGKFRKDDFQIDVDAGTVTCPAGRLVPIRRSKNDGGIAGIAAFAPHCSDCPLRSQCTDSKGGRTIKIHAREKTLQHHRKRQRDPTWKQRYKATRPKVERKFGHMMRRRHGGRRARVRGTLRVDHDFSLLAAATNLQRLAILGVHHENGAWTR